MDEIRGRPSGSADCLQTRARRGGRRPIALRHGFVVLPARVGRKRVGGADRRAKSDRRKRRTGAGDLRRLSQAPAQFRMRRRIERLTERRIVESVPRAVASVASIEAYLWEPRSLPLAVLIRRGFSLFAK